ncbi:hypothetical protein AGIG_G19815 [Arapaima gigas]
MLKVLQHVKGEEIIMAFQFAFVSWQCGGSFREMGSSPTGRALGKQERRAYRRRDGLWGGHGRVPPSLI